MAIADNSFAVRYAGIDLNVCEMIEMSREPVHDRYGGGDYLFHQWNLEYKAVFNPGAISGSWNIAGGVPFEESGRMPALTDNAIRDLLMKPRETLIVTVGGVSMLVSPQDALHGCDAYNGPLVKFCTVKAIPGIRLFRVHMRIVTFVRQVNDVDPVISNRWSAIEDIDENFMIVRQYEGEARFNVGLLYKLNRRPDQYRNTLLPGCPTDFKRENIRITATDDGAAVRYFVTDRQRTHNMNSNLNITKAEIIRSSNLGYKHPTGVVASTIGNVASSFGQFAAMAIGFGASTSAAGRVGAVAAGVQAPGNIIRGVTPGFSWSISVRLTGDKTCSRSRLTAFAFGLAFTRLGLGSFTNAVISSDSFMSSDVDMIVDEVGKFVEVNMTHHTGIEALFSAARLVSTDGRAVAAVTATFNGAPPAPVGKLIAVGWETENINVGVEPMISIVQTTPNPMPPNDNNSRGYFTGRLVAQLFSDNAYGAVRPLENINTPS